MLYNVEFPNTNSLVNYKLPVLGIGKCRYNSRIGWDKICVFILRIKTGPYARKLHLE